MQVFQSEEGRKKKLGCAESISWHNDEMHEKENE